MIINKYFSKSTLYPGVKCNICDDLIGKGSRQEFYNVVEVVGDKQILRYAGMSKEFWYNRPIKGHNATYNTSLSTDPSRYIIYRWKCTDAAILEAAAFCLIKGCTASTVWNIQLSNSRKCTPEDVKIVCELWQNYNITIE